jgi:hypothetical protein
VTAKTFFGDLVISAKSTNSAIFIISKIFDLA